MEDRGECRKLALEKVKVVAIRSELERERERVFTVGDVECVGLKEVKGRLKPKEGEGSVSVGGKNVSEVSREYLPFHEDVEWANKSILAKIKNGMCISVIQQSFLDAGFLDFKLISLGGDNVLLHPCVEGDVMEIFNSAADLIGNFLCDCQPWTKDVSVPYERSA